MLANNSKQLWEHGPLHMAHSLSTPFLGKVFRLGCSSHQGGGPILPDSVLFEGSEFLAILGIRSPINAAVSSLQPLPMCAGVPLCEVSACGARRHDFVNLKRARAPPGFAADGMTSATRCMPIQGDSFVINQLQRCGRCVKRKWTRNKSFSHSLPSQP